MEPIRGTGYYDYAKVKTQTTTTKDEGESFSLNDQSEKKNQEKTTARMEEEGVVVELSGQKQSNAQYQPQNGTSVLEKREQESQSIIQTAAQIVDSIKKFMGQVQEFFESVQGMLKRFWNDEEIVVENIVEADSIEEQSVDANQEIIPDPGSETYVDQIEEFLEKKQGSYVKNSDLLTYYDRQGNIVKMSGSDRNRILRGDKNELKG